jgi:GDP-L-fucose synthase
MKTVFVAGHRGMVGAAIVKNLEQRGGVFIITRTRSELDLTARRRYRSFLPTTR